jgi:hypothetical protein
VFVRYVDRPLMAELNCSCITYFTFHASQTSTSMISVHCLNWLILQTLLIMQVTCLQLMAMRDASCACVRSPPKPIGLILYMRT